MMDYIDAGKKSNTIPVIKELCKAYTLEETALQHCTHVQTYLLCWVI